MKEKLCPKCKQTKLLTEFYSAPDRPDGVRTPCKECAKAHYKHRYRTNGEYRERQQEQSKVRTKKRRLELTTYILKYLKESGCVDCGENDPLVLEFDHLRDKTEGISRMVRKHASLDAIKEEISKCVVRCANCHRRKTAAERNYYSDIDLNTL